MNIAEDNTNAVGNLTVSNGTDFNIDRRSFEDLFPMIGNYSTTGSGSTVSNAITESYMNVLCPYRIDMVIFNDPATIVIWNDKTKTVVKCHDEPFDREKGLAMCIAKKVLDKDFHKTFREWCE